MPKFRKKPVIVEALQYTGENEGEIIDFAPMVVDWTEGGDGGGEIHKVTGIKTLEGEMEIFPGDWIVKYGDGELHPCEIFPCKPDIFENAYEPVDEA